MNSSRSSIVYIIYYILFISSNIYFSSEAGYFDLGADVKPLLHTWSLSVEEQFYFILPWICVFIGYKNKVLFNILILIMIAVSLVYANAMQPSAPVNVFFLLQFRAWELLCGVFLAMNINLLKKIGVDHKFVGNLLALIGLGMIISSVVFYDTTTIFPGVSALLPVCGTVLVIAYANDDTWINKILSLPLLLTIGQISFGLYLWHQPVFSVVRVWGSLVNNPWIILFAIICVSLLSYTSWLLIEKPFRNPNFVSRRMLWISVISAYMLILTFVFVVEKGLIFSAHRISQEMIKNTKRILPNFGLNKLCENEFTLDGHCRTSSEPEFVLWGDSYAMHLAPGLVSSDPDIKLIQFTKSGCGPFLNYAPFEGKLLSHKWAEGCVDFNAKVFEWIKNSRSVKYVILASPFHQYTTSGIKFVSDGEVVDFNITRSISKFNFTLNELIKLGVIPVIIAPPPQSNFDVGVCLIRSQEFGFYNKWCQFDSSDYDWRYQGALSFLAVIDKKYPLIRLEEFLCPNGTCKMLLSDQYIYRDVGHLSVEGSFLIGKQIGLTNLIRQTALRFRASADPALKN